MAYGKIKADTLVYDNSGSDVEKTVASLAAAAPTADPTFTGTVTVPTASANDNTTKAASTAYVQTELGDYAPLAAPALTGTATAVNLTLSGNLIVNGSTTTVNSSTLEVEDKNIELGKVSTPTDTTADGGGITLKGATDKTFNWVDATDSWTSSEHIHIGDSKKLKLGTGSDFVAYFDGSNTYLAGVAGNVNIQAKETEESIVAKPDGAVELYHNNVKKLETTTAGVTVTGTVTDSLGHNVRKIPVNTKTSAYTAVAGDAYTAFHTTHGITINNSVFSSGDAVTIVNNSGSNITITQGSGLTIHNSADAATGNRTLAGRGMATLWFADASTAYISGSGLS